MSDNDKPYMPGDPVEVREPDDDPISAHAAQPAQEEEEKPKAAKPQQTQAAQPSSSGKTSEK